MEREVLGLVVLVFVVWLVWRAILALRLLLAPVRKITRPIAQKVEAHIEDAARRSGMGGLIDLGKRIDRGIEKAMDASQKNIDARNK